jgi:uncharacterized protein YbjT (DUF2867 family)
MILVTGATGNTGCTLLQQLEGRGARVRAMVRRQPDGGRLRGTSATTVAGDFNDSRSLEAALAGVTRAYLVTPSSPDAEAQQIRFAELAAAAGVRHVVKLSHSLPPTKPSPVRFLRYHAYFQGFLAFQSMIANDIPVGTSKVKVSINTFV